MKTNIFSAAVLALCLCLGAGSLAYGQDDEGGFPFPPEPAAKAPKPVNPALKSLDSGRLMIVVGSPRAFGYHIGDLIPVTMVISADPNVQVNLEALKRNTLSTDGSDFELAGSPVITKEERAGKTIWRVQLLLRSWVIKPQLVLNLDFHYATELLPDGKTPNWRPVSTPDFVVETSNTATEASEELLEGDMGLKESPKPALVKPLQYGAYVLLSLLPAWLLWRLWQRVRPARALTRSEIAWLEFDQVMDEAKQEGKLSYEHLKRISGALHLYLRIESIPTSEVAIPLEEFFTMHDNKMELMTIAVSALSKLERALYSKSTLTDNEELALMQEIERIVPRD